MLLSKLKAEKRALIPKKEEPQKTRMLPKVLTVHVVPLVMSPLQVMVMKVICTQQVALLKIVLLDPLPLVCLLMPQTLSCQMVWILLH